jgi:hypothetical protein
MAASRSGRARGRSSAREVVSFATWHLLMLAWFVGWLLGVWWVWPVIAQFELNFDLVSALFWLVTGGTAWLIALTLGYRRYWLR